jgi:hypothetical protein
VTYQPPRGTSLGDRRNGMPVSRPYVYRGDQSPGAARLRARTAEADLAARIAASPEAGPGPDDVGYEWRREQAAEAADLAVDVIPLRQPAPGSDEPVPYQLTAKAEAALARPGPLAAPEPAAAPPERCPVCRYLESSVGHRVNCGG